MRGDFTGIAAALVLCGGGAAFADRASAQPASADVPPVVQSVDENGIDQVSGQLVQVLASISIGAGGPGSITYNWANSNQGRTELFGFVRADTPAQSKYSVSVGGATETFTLTGALGSGTFTQDQGRSSTLTYDSATSRYTYTRTDGAVAVIDAAGIQTLTYPAGERLTYYYRTIPATTGYPFTYQAVRSIVSNLGYQLHYDYALVPGDYYSITSVVLFNMAVESCDPNADTCSLTGNWPRISFTHNNTPELVGTDNIGRVYRMTNTAQPPHNGQPGTPGMSTLVFPTGRTLTYQIDQHGRVYSFSDGRGTWAYSRPNPPGTTTLTTYPEQNGPPRQVMWDAATGQIVREITRNVETNYTYYPDDRLWKVKVTNGPEIRYTYDSRGNVIEARRISATPGTPPDIVTTADFPDSCPNPRTCNRPESTTDARGHTTNFEYDPAHGGVATVTLPPAEFNAVRPQVRYGYTALSANYRDSNGNIVQGTPVYRLTSISQCATLASCANTADEVRTTIAYGANDALLPVSATSGSGDNALAATTESTYTSVGDVRTVNGPLPGTEDTVRNYYDAARQLTGVIGPDPDGSGFPLPHRAVRTTYNGDRQPTSVEAGSAQNQTDTGMSTFVSLEQTQTGYDAQGRVTSSRTVSGGTTHSLSQFSTTLSGFPECTAVRMNPAAFASPPASACTQGTAGSFGPDRISRIAYDAFRRLPTTLTTAVGTPLEAVEQTRGYDALNRVVSVTDANGNLTGYTYDGLARPARTNFPSPATPGQYEEFSYEPALSGSRSTTLISALRLRDGQSIEYVYDWLRRLVVKNLPGSELDVSYGYDLLGRRLSASQTEHTLSFTFDALGRNRTQTGPLGTIQSQWDLAGRRTRLIHPDGFTVAYDHLVTGEVSRIREHPDAANFTLATFAYDNLSRRTSLTRGNGTVTSYAYDPASRLQSLGENLFGTAHDLNLNFGYNPAGQITTRTANNDLWAWTTLANGSTSWTPNGLNQVTQVGGPTLAYDARGNLINDGVRTFTYSSENLLTRFNTYAVNYDPLMRLHQVVYFNTNRFLYDRDQFLAEMDGGNTVVRRFVYGAGIDEPLVWYEGSGAGAVRRYFHADERGTVHAVSRNDGGIYNLNRHDEYGNNGGLGLGIRFAFTGQAWFREMGLYYYRARWYHPVLGRFMQTDPIGYEGGMNLYAYVRNDPVNFTDPLGLQELCHATPNSNTIIPCPPIVSTGSRFGTADVHYSSVYFQAGVSTAWSTPGSPGPGVLGPAAGQQGGQCSADAGPVSFEGSITVVPVGIASYRGSFWNPATGQRGRISGLGFGGGLAFGNYTVSATVSSIAQIERGFDVSFSFIGVGIRGLNLNLHSSATFRTHDGDMMGQGSVGSDISVQFLGAGGASFEQGEISDLQGRSCG